VTLLGIDQVVQIVLMKSGLKLLSGSQEGYGLHEGAMWKYSVSSALIAKQIAKRLSLENNHTIFTAALLKDIGKTVPDKFVLDSFEKISALVVHESLSFREAEKRVIGVDHAELGMDADDISRVIARFAVNMQEVEDLLKVV